MIRSAAWCRVARRVALLCFLAHGTAHAQPIVVERLSDACSGGCDGFRPDTDLGSHAVGKTRVYFVGKDAAGYNHDRPWVSDGTPAGTIPLVQIPTDGYGVGLASMVTVGDMLYFTARAAAMGDWADGRRLWRSDGTPAGTLPVDFPIGAPKVLPPADSYHRIYATSRGVVYPSANAGIWWVPADGTTPRKLVDGYLLGSGPVEWNGDVYFLAVSCQSQCVAGTVANLQRFDGSSVVVLLGSLPLELGTNGLGYPVGDLSAVPEGLFMTMQQTLWASDGTVAPHLLRQWSPPALIGLPVTKVVSTMLLLPVSSGGPQSQLWTSDGTAEGTRAITSFGANAGVGLRPLGVAGVAPVLSLEATTYPSGYPDVPEEYPRYSELAVLDGAYPTGTRALRTLASGAGTAAPSNGVAFDGGIVFFARGPNGSNPPTGDMFMWITDGTAGGTRRIDFAAFGNAAAPTLVGAIGRTLYFAGVQPETGSELYRMTLPPDYPPKYATVEVTEYYHGGFDHYFVTGNPAEKVNLDSGETAGWARTGFGFTAYASGSAAPGVSPVCRFYGRPEAGLDSHFYSASPQECAEVVAKFPGAWIYESADVFEVALPDATGRCGTSLAPVYRAFNGRADVNHRYSVHSLDQKAMQAKGWQPEGMTSAGLVMCALAASRP